MRIAFIEDDELVRNSLSKFIRMMLKCEVDTFADGLEGYTHLKNNLNNYDMIISDIVMPKLDGIQMLEKLISDGLTLPPTIIVSGNIKTEIPGIVDFIGKPVDISELLAKIKYHIHLGII